MPFLLVGSDLGPAAGISRELEWPNRTIPSVTTYDGEIIRRSLEQPAAFAELYDRHERVIFRYAARRLGASEADDIASETFLVAFTRRRDFTGSENARPWLLGIATTLMRQHARTEAKAWRGMLASDLAAPISTRTQGSFDVSAPSLTRHVSGS